MRWADDRIDPAAYAEPGVDLPVFYGDLDTNRHVNNVALGRYFEQARLETHRGAGIDRIVRAEGGSLLVARVAIDYVAEVHYGSPLHIRVRVCSVGRSSMHEEQAAWQNDRCVALAEVVAVHRRDGAAAEWPEAARAAWLSLRPTDTSASVSVSE